jgi:hypothetical protein
MYLHREQAKKRADQKTPLVVYSYALSHNYIRGINLFNANCTYARIRTTIIAIGRLHPPKGNCTYITGQKKFPNHFVLHGQDLLCKRRDSNHSEKFFKKRNALRIPSQYHTKWAFFVQPSHPRRFEHWHLLIKSYAYILRCCLFCVFSNKA